MLAGRAALGIEDTAAHHLLSTVVSRQRARGAISELLPPLTRLALAEILTGFWRSADTTAHEALQSSQATGHRELSAFPLALARPARRHQGTRGGPPGVDRSR